MCSDSTRINEQVETNICCNNTDGSSAKVTLFSSSKILLFWKVFDWLQIMPYDEGLQFCFMAHFNIDYLFPYFLPK